MILGIDFGTSRIRACWGDEGGRPRFVTNEHGDWAMPSVVALEPDGEVVVGWEAADPDPRMDRRRIYGAKSRLGRASTETASVGDLTPVEQAGCLLARVIAEAEAQAGETVDGVILAVPARYDFAQRNAIMQAASLASIEVLRLVHESTAAALARRRPAAGDETVAVVDLGAGTLDISILQTGDGIVEVVSAGGDLNLGGLRFDERMEGELLRILRERHGVWPEELDPMTRRRIREAAEAAKIDLSSAAVVSITIPHMNLGDGRTETLDVEFTRKAFLELVRDLVEGFARACVRCLADAGLKVKSVHRVCLVGGGSRIPAVESAAADVFGPRLDRSLDRDRSAAIGALRLGHWLTGSRAANLLLDIVPGSYGIALGRDRMRHMVVHGASIPLTRRARFVTTKDAQSAVRLRVYEGESDSVDENEFVGSILLTGLPEQSAGRVRVDVELSVDTSATVSIRGREVSTGRSVAASFDPVGGMSSDRQIGAWERIQAFRDETRAEMAFLRDAAGSPGVRRWLDRVEEWLGDRAESLPAELRDRLESVSIELGRVWKDPADPLASVIVVREARSALADALRSRLESELREAACSGSLLDWARHAAGGVLAPPALGEVQEDLKRRFREFEDGVRALLEQLPLHHRRRALIRSVRAFGGAAHPTLGAAVLLRACFGIEADVREVRSIARDLEPLARLFLLGGLRSDVSRRRVWARLLDQTYRGKPCPFLLAFWALEPDVRAADLLSGCVEAAPTVTWLAAWRELSREMRGRIAGSAPDPSPRAPAVRAVLRGAAEEALACADDRDARTALVILAATGGDGRLSDLADAARRRLDRVSSEDSPREPVVPEAPAEEATETGATEHETGWREEGSGDDPGVRIGDLYSVLGVTRTATAQEIRRAYLRGVRKTTPEDDPDGFRRLSEAYRILSDPERRRDHDRGGHVPDDAAAQIDRAHRFVGQRDAGRAREIANDLLTTHPDIDAVRFEAARILLHADRADQARAVLQDLVARRPEDAAVRSDYGAALFITGSAMEGLRVLEEAIALEPTNSGIYARLAEYLVILGQVDGAIASLTRGIEAAEERLPTLPLMLHLLWLRAFSRDRMGMRATVGMILLAIPAEDREAREQIASRLVALGQESDLRMLRRISDDCAHVLGALSRRDPDLYRDVARALADPAVPDWTLEIVFVSLMGSEGDENRARFKDVVRAVKRAGVHGCAARWERFREKHPHLGSRGGPLWRSVREATEGYG